MNPLPKVAMLLDKGRGFERGMLRGIARYTNLHSPWVVLRPVEHYQHFYGYVTQSWEEIRNSEPDGIILNECRLVEPLLSLGIPLMVIPVYGLTAGAVNLIGDNAGVAAIAAEHLLSLGLTNFAFAGFDRAAWSVERCTAFCHRLAEAGHRVNVHLVPLARRAAKRFYHQAATVTWLKSLPKPVGILGCNDDFSRSLLEMARIHGLRVPDQIALVGVDNDELICELTTPPLSSVAFAVERAGYEAAERLDQLMAGQTTNKKDVRVHASHLVVRQSTDMLAIADEEVVKAVRFIRRNAHRVLPIREVVEATLLSQRTLNNRFRRAVGHCVFTEINRQRAAHIARRLLTSDEPIARLARSVGYDDPAHMTRFFQRQMGLTPRAYRLRRPESTSKDPGA